MRSLFEISSLISALFPQRLIKNCGVSDEYEFHPAVGRMQMTVLHATPLGWMDLDHETLTYRNAGRDFRLTHVAERITCMILA